MGEVSSAPFHRLGACGSEGGSDLFKVAQRVGTVVGIQTLVGLPCRCTPSAALAVMPRQQTGGRE